MTTVDERTEEDASFSNPRSAIISRSNDQSQFMSRADSHDQRYPQMKGSSDLDQARNSNPINNFDDV